jgi:hypothetical protein
VNSTEATKIIESLRQGIPPEGSITEFTVGRKEEIGELHDILLKKEGKALLLRANYGSGKTHLLKLIREMALSSGYAVSLITLDAKSAVRFNRMDQIFGQVCRQLEMPGKTRKSIRNLFDSISSACSHPKSKFSDEIVNLTNGGKWDYSRYLNSPALYVAVRAWCFGNEQTKDLIEDWLFQPWEYKSQRKHLYLSLVESMRRHFRDPRAEWQFYADKTCDFSDQGYRQSWDALNDLDKLTKVAGYNGLILLVDEFEDVIHNLGNIKYQESAFWNLFQFFGGNYCNNSFFAVTPDFSEKCKALLLTKDRFDYDYSRFDDLKTFELSPLSENEMYSLSQKIISSHSKAYSWKVPNDLDNHIRIICKNGMKIPVQDRVRQTIKETVNLLDSSMGEFCD